jgi:hypothetical protein
MKYRDRRAGRRRNLLCVDLGQSGAQACETTFSALRRHLREIGDVRHFTLTRSEFVRVALDVLRQLIDKHPTALDNCLLSQVNRADPQAGQ